jgi:hypothetical protein
MRSASSLQFVRKLMREEILVHLPELSLRGRRLGSFGGELRVLVRAPIGEVAKDEAKLAGQSLIAHAQDTGVREPAVAALVVAVLGKRHGRARRSRDVIACWINRRCEAGDARGERMGHVGKVNSAPE